MAPELAPHRHRHPWPPQEVGERALGSLSSTGEGARGSPSAISTAIASSLLPLPWSLGRRPSSAGQGARLPASLALASWRGRWPRDGHGLEGQPQPGEGAGRGAGGEARGGEEGGEGHPALALVPSVTPCGRWRER